MKKIVLLLALVIPLTLSSQTTRIFENIDRFWEQGLFDTTYDYLIWNATRDLLSGTQYEAKININGKLDTNLINIYVWSNDPYQDFDVCNCAYIGKKTIICDRKIFDYFFSLISSVVNSTQNDSTFNSTGVNLGPVLYLFDIKNRFFVFQWILGHELGHLVKDHPLGHFYIPNSAVEESNKFLKSQIEIEADTFFINRVQNNEDKFFFWLAMSNFLSSMYPEHTLSDWNNNDSSEIILYFDKYKHPPFFYRFLTMVMLLIKNNEDSEVLVDESGYFEFLLKRLKLVDNKDSVAYSGCNFTATPYLDADKLIEWLDAGIENNFDIASSLLRLNQNSAAKKLLEYTIQEINKSYGELDEDEFMLYSKVFTSKAQLDFIDGNYQSAVNHLKISTEFYPPDYSTCNLFAMSYYLLDSMDQAEFYWNKSWTLKQDNAECYFGLCLFNLGKNRLHDALKFRKIASMLTNQANWKNQLKFDYYWPKKLIDRIPSHDSDLSDISNGLLDTISSVIFDLYKKKEYRKALSVSHRIKNSNVFLKRPSDLALSSAQGLYLNLDGMIYIQMGKLDSCKLAYEKALQIRTNVANQEPHSFIYQFYRGQTLNNLGNLYVKALGDSITGVQYYHDAIAQYKLAEPKTNFNLIPEIAKAYVNLSIAYEYSKRYREALNALDSLVDIIYNANENEMVLGLLLESQRIKLTTLKNVFEETEDPIFLKEGSLSIETFVSQFNKYTPIFGYLQISKIKKELKPFKDYFNDDIVRNYHIGFRYLNESEELHPDSIKYFECLEKSI